MKKNQGTTAHELKTDLELLEALQNQIQTVRADEKLSPSAREAELRDLEEKVIAIHFKIKLLGTSHGAKFPGILTAEEIKEVFDSILGKRN